MNKQGVIKWIGEPKELNKSILTSFIKDQEIVTTEIHTDKKAIKNKQVDFMSLFKNKEQDFYLELTKVSTEGVEFSKKSIGNELIELQSATLEEIYKNALDHTFIKIPQSLLSQQFDLLYKNTNKKTSLSELERLLLDDLQLQKRIETKTMQVADVQITNENLLEEALEKKFSAKSDADGSIIFTGYTIADMIKEVNKAISSNYRYQGDNTVKYDFIIGISSTKATNDSFSSYGLGIEQRTKEQEYVILEKK